MNNIKLFNNIQKEMILQFTNKTNIACNTNDNTCIKDIKNNIINSLTYAIEKYLDINVLNILEQDVTLISTIGNNKSYIKYTSVENTNIKNIRNKIYIEIENSIRNENIFELIQSIKKKNLITSNYALLLIKEDLIINTINKIIFIDILIKNLINNKYG
jgi:hypothetical protein